MNKGGLSAVVTTLIIILLTIVAIGIVWVVVKNVLDKGSEEITLTGLTLDLEIVKAVVEDMGTPSDTSDDFLNITVKRNKGEGDLVAIDFIFSDGDNSVVVRRDTTLKELEWQTFTFAESTLAIGEIVSVSVAPVFETSSGKEIIGETVDTTTSSGGSLGSGDPSYDGTPGGDTGGESSCIPTTGCTINALDCGDFTNDCGTQEYCGDCDVGFVCGVDNMCYSEECTPEDPSITCSGYECGNVTNNCGQDVDCTALLGSCSSQYYLANWECVDNMCSEITYLIAGQVDSVWPPDTRIYFDTDDPPIDDPVLNYGGNYVKFPGSAESECLLIQKSVVPSDPITYNKTIIYLFAIQTDIAAGDNFEIWDTFDHCYGI